MQTVDRRILTAAADSLYHAIYYNLYQRLILEWQLYKAKMVLASCMHLQSFA